MSTMQFVRRCCNCGAILQSEHPEEEGYVDEKYLQKELSAMIFCASCYASARYNMMPAYPKLDEDYNIMIQDAEARDALIIYVVDLFSFECSFIPELTKTIEGLNMIIIANKRDLMPSSVSDAELREYVAHRFRRAKLNVTADDVVLTSFTSLSDTSMLSRMMEERRKGHDVYIIGASMAGKTLFLNAYLRSYRNNTNRSVIRDNYPGTNLAVLEIPLDHSSSIYDTPGTSLDNSVVHLLDEEGRKAAIPSKRIKSRRIALGNHDRLYIGGAVRLDLLSKEKTVLKCYFAEGVTLNKHHGKLGEAELIALMKKKGFVPQISSISSISDLDVYEIHVEEQGQRDIGIEGLGWISFAGDNQVFRIYVPKGIGVYTSRAKVKK